MSSEELPPPAPALYFTGMIAHAGTLFVRRYFGKKAARLLLGSFREVANTWLADGPGYSVRADEPPDVTKAKAAPTARMLLAWVDAIEVKVLGRGD